jgi:hypothetical protein
LGSFVTRASENIRLVSASNWDTDSWNPRAPTVGTVVAPHDGCAHWESDGGFFRGCSATLVW